jgi:phospholipid/cholesterol/gamma-HCH transport system ATP-binding protein
VSAKESCGGEEAAGRRGETVIKVSGLKKSLGGRRILEGIDLQVRRGEILVIMGGSGCGKSTLLRHLMGALDPDEGRVEVFGQDLESLDEDGLNAVRKRFGVLYQSGALFNSLTVGENVLLPLREHSSLQEEILQIVMKMKLELVGLRGFESLMPSQLSGGMRKRVGLARAVALDPEIIFYDEPGTGLDPIMAAVIDKLVVDLSHKLGVTSVVVTHEMKSAFRIAHRMVMLYEGRIVAEGTPEEIRGSPNPLVQQFIRGEPDGPIPLRCSRLDYETDLLT